MCWPVGKLVSVWLCFSLPVTLCRPSSFCLFPSGRHTSAVLQSPEDAWRVRLRRRLLSFVSFSLFWEVQILQILYTLHFWFLHDELHFMRMSLDFCMYCFFFFTLIVYHFVPEYNDTGSDIWWNKLADSVFININTSSDSYSTPPWLFVLHTAPSTTRTSAVLIVLSIRRKYSACPLYPPERCGCLWTLFVK